MTIAIISLLIFLIAMFSAALSDMRTMTIHSWTSLLLIAGFLLIIPFIWSNWIEIGNPWIILGEHILVGIVVFLVGFVMFIMGWLGGGDAKLMAATAFWWHWADLFYYLVYTTVAGGLIAIFILFGRKFLPVRILTSPWVYRLVKDEKDMPYGLALAFGALATLPQSNIFEAAIGIL